MWLTNNWHILKDHGEKKTITKKQAMNQAKREYIEEAIREAGAEVMLLRCRHL